MGILEQLAGDLAGGAGGGTASPIAGAVMGLLGGGGNSQGTMAGSGPQPGGIGGAGGLAGLVGMFEQAGLGHIVQSWIGSGQNQAVSPSQLQTVLGDERVNGLAAQSGMAPQDFLSQLAQHLPGMVDRMTPQGQLQGQLQGQHAGGQTEWV